MFLIARRIHIDLQAVRYHTVYLDQIKLSSVVANNGIAIMTITLNKS
jgi:hypothetical protein